MGMSTCVTSARGKFCECGDGLEEFKNAANLTECRSIQSYAKESCLTSEECTGNSTCTGRTCQCPAWYEEYLDTTINKYRCRAVQAVVGDDCFDAVKHIVSLSLQLPLQSITGMHRRVNLYRQIQVPMSTRIHRYSRRPSVPVCWSMYR